LIDVVVRLYFQKIILLFIKEIISRIEVHVERKVIVLLLKEDKRWMFVIVRKLAHFLSTTPACGHLVN
jgi:hypothetical protein